MTRELDFYKNYIKINLGVIKYRIIKNGSPIGNEK